MGLLVACAMGVGCNHVVQVAPVTVVPTRTAGVAFVVVRPTAKVGEGKHRIQPSDGKPIDATSQYILLCDARGVDGMRCAIPTEAAIARFSYTPRSGRAAVPVDEGVGTLADISTHLTKEKEPDDTTPAAGSDAKAPAQTTAPNEPAAAAGSNTSSAPAKEGQK